MFSALVSRRGRPKMSVDVLGAGQQAGQAEDVPGGIVHMDGHLDVALMADRHQRFEEVLQVLPQLFLGDGGVGLEQLVELGHPLRLPAGEGHVVLLGEAHDVVGHRLVVALDHVLLVVQSGRAVAHRVEQVGAGPVKDGHEVVADHLHAELGQVADGLDVVGDVLISGGQADLDVVVDVDRFDHIHVEAVRLQLLLHLGDLIDLPDLAGHLVVQGPDDAGDAGDLLDVGQGDLVVAFAIPAETHLHWHSLSLLCAEFTRPPRAGRRAASCCSYSSISIRIWQVVIYPFFGSDFCVLFPNEKNREKNLQVLTVYFSVFTKNVPKMCTTHPSVKKSGWTLRAASTETL